MSDPHESNDEVIAEKAAEVYFWENQIDEQRQLYLFTWCPKPSDLPDSDFELQHKFCINAISDYLKTCRCGLACVESTQIGNPHYHGWYQLDDDPIKSRYRIAIVKVLQRLGMLKITQSIGKYRINRYTQHANCLYYYKKDCFDSMLWVKSNPISKDTRDETQWTDMSSFFVVEGKRQSVQELSERVANYKFYKGFYMSSNDWHLFDGLL